MSKELEALNKLTEYIKLDEYDYETRGVGDAERLLVKALTELEELKRDVKRYFELEGNYQKSSHEYHEMEYIKNKLMEVGKEDV